MVAVHLGSVRRRMSAWNGLEQRSYFYKMRGDELLLMDGLKLCIGCHTVSSTRRILLLLSGGLQSEPAIVVEFTS